jgi:putative transposase
MNREPFENGEIYHIYNRGVDKRDVFMDDKDRYRFIHDLFEFNDEKPVINVDYRFTKQQDQSMGIRLPYIEKKPRKLLADVLAFCLMNNHFHLMLVQKSDGGVTRLMRKLGAGYTNYFNEKYNRSGALFQGKFKSVHLEKQAHFLYLPHYIHLNPAEIIGHSIKALKDYRWSSLPDYLGKKNFPSITQREFLLDVYGGTDGYEKDFRAWTNDANLAGMEKITID